MAQGGLKKKGGGEGPAHYKATSPHPLPHSGDGPWGGVGGCSTRGSARDVSTRYLQNSRDPSQHRPTSIAPPHPTSAHSSQGAQHRSPPWPSPAGPPPSWATSSQRHSSPRPSGTLSWHPCPLSCWDPHPTPGRRLLTCNSQGHALPPGRGPRSPPQQVRDRAGGHPSTPNKMTNKRKQTKTEDSPLPRPQEGAEGGGVEGGRREQACSLGQIFCCFIRFSVNQLEFARTGVGGGVSKRARAGRARERASPAARAFTSRSSSVQTLRS